MIKIDRVRAVPIDLEAIIEEQVGSAGLQMVRSFLALSVDAGYATENGAPLFLVGAYTNSLFDQDKELWFVATPHLTAKHIRPARKLFQRWLAQQSGKVRARCAQPQHERFVRLFGLTELYHDGTMMLFEARNG